MAFNNRTLRPYRDYDEKDVLNFATYTGTSTDFPVHKGTFVKLTGAAPYALIPGNPDTFELLGDYGGYSLSNVVSQRYGVLPKYGVAGNTDNPIGMTLFDYRESDENGELLKYKPNKAAEMEAILSGQAGPVVTRGTFQYSGLESGSLATQGGSAYCCGPNGILTAFSGASGSPNVKIGKFLGGTGVAGDVYFWLNIQN